MLSASRSSSGAAALSWSSSGWVNPVESARAAGRALIARGKLATAVLGLGSGLESAAAIAESLMRRAA